MSRGLVLESLRRNPLKVHSIASSSGGVLGVHCGSIGAFGSQHYRCVTKVTPLFLWPIPSPGMRYWSSGLVLVGGPVVAGYRLYSLVGGVYWTRGIAGDVF